VMLPELPSFHVPPSWEEICCMLAYPFVTRCLGASPCCFGCHGVHKLDLHLPEFSLLGA
jgi:hypothetical protein